MSIVFPHEVSVLYGRTSSVRYRAVLAASVLALGLGGFVVGYLLRSPGALEPDLARLLRLMALVKLGMVVGATWLVVWRLSSPCGPNFAGGYGVAVALMTTAPGLIWFTSHPIVAFGLFHAGLVLGLVLAFRDEHSMRFASLPGSEQVPSARKRASCVD
jgi:hypothetical protein